MIGAAVSVTAALVVASGVYAQSNSPTAVGQGTQASPSASASQADGPEALFAHWDTNHDQQLSPAEFRLGWKALEANLTLRRLRAQFVARDTDKSGCLNAAEYAQLALIKSAGTSAPPMTIFDTQRDRCLDFKEYVGLVEYMVKQ
ncbi:MAG: EF-hand domain-containing protein [Rhodanobacter sp.]